MKLKLSAMLLVAIASVSCKDENKKGPTAPMSNEMHQEDIDENNTNEQGQDANAETVLNEYFGLKDALVDDDNSKAKEYGNALAMSLKSFDISSYSDSEESELKELVEDAMEQAERIGESDIKQQREHFKTLSKKVTDMVAITGTDQKLYEQFCPMYDGGTAWLSNKEEIRNPYYGSQMLKCGKVQREIN